MSKKTKRPAGRSGQVTLDNIAQACGVSRMSVSYALRGQRQFVSAANIERITRIAKQMGYDPAVSHAARSLRYQKQRTNIASYVVAVFFPMELLELHYYAMLLRGIHQALIENHFGVLSCHIDADGPPIADQLPQIFRRGDIDGALIMPTAGYDHSLVEALHSMSGFEDRPIVSLLQPLPGCDAVVADDVEVGRLAAAHLLELGHRHLLRFSNPRGTNVIVERRLKGHSLAFKEAGLDLKRHLHTAPWVWDDPRGLETAMLEILAKHPEITAILAPNDSAGIAVARTLRQMGKRLPADLSIIGADDCEMFYGADDQNVWTTVRVPLQSIGSNAASTLVERLKQKDAQPEVQTLPVELVVRGTTSPPAKSRSGR